MSARGNAAIKIAAELLDLPFSPFEDDWPKSMPKRVLRRFEEQGNQLRELAWRVRYMGNCLAELDRECARKDARIAELEACLRERDGGDHDPHCRIWMSGWQKKADRFCTCGHIEARALLEQKPLEPSTPEPPASGG